jgi:uncharacterized protein with PIN domain
MESAVIIKPKRFLCDEMLKGLSRWLRAAGYNTKNAEQGEDDRELIGQAIEEKRLLLTRDRKVMEIRHAQETAILLETNSLAEWAEELKKRLALDWLYNPFSRCLICNTPLRHADPACIEQVPKQSQVHLHTLLYCDHCKKLYWDGGHVRRMREVLSKWNGDT